MIGGLREARKANSLETLFDGSPEVGYILVTQPGSATSRPLPKMVRFE